MRDIDIRGVHVCVCTSMLVCWYYEMEYFVHLGLNNTINQRIMDNESKTERESVSEHLIWFH